MAWTCPTELTAALPSLPVDRAIHVERHVAWEVASQMDSSARSAGAPVRWMADSYDSPEVWGAGFLADNRDALYSACESASAIQAVRIVAGKVVPVTPWLWIG